MDTVRTWITAPNYDGSIKGDVTKVSMAQNFTNTFTHKSGTKFVSSFNISEFKYRLQNRSDNNKSWSNSIIMSLRPGLLWNTLYSDSRVFNRIISLSGGLQDFIVNTKTGSSTLQYFKFFSGGTKLDARSAISLSKSEKVFKVDSRLQGSAGGGIIYKFGKRINFMGRAYYANARDQSETSFQKLPGLGEAGDSLVSQVILKLPADADMKIHYSRATTTTDYVDLPRGIFFQQKLDEEDLIKEKHVSDHNILYMDATTHPLKPVSLKMYAEHSVDLDDYEVAKKRFTKSTTDILRGELTYKYSSNPNNTLVFKSEKQNMLRDLGPLSVSSYNQKQKSATLLLNHSFHQTLSISAQAGATLSQFFYVNFDINPRDRDQLNQFMQAKLSSKPFPKFDAGVFLAVSSVDYINIDRSLSGDNRRETTYDFRPEFTYHLNDRIGITQKYGLNIEFSDFVFSETDNFLDRNITFSNTIEARLTGALAATFHYGLLLHDRGSYRLNASATERTLNISQEDRKDQLSLKMRYALTPHLNVLTRQEYAQRRDRIVISGSETTFPEGKIEGGLEGKYVWEEGKELSFSLLKVNRFGSFNTEEQNSYWLMSTNIKYAF